MVFYLTEREMQEREIDDGRNVTARNHVRIVAPVPMAVAWTCFGTAWDIENTLTVLYATYSHIEKLFVVIPMPPPSLPPDPLNDEGEENRGEGGTRTRSRVFMPAPKEQNLVYQEGLCDVEPVPLLTEDHQIRLWDEEDLAYNGFRAEMLFVPIWCGKDSAGLAGVGRC
ncbi:uncharacterized protein PG998_001537 [Apiospora kogelbergensis]|uniref:uncharacterized protein n=1 Tax=Apiospora kogelbergensis TaxID=1337665 RepID=UPI0031306E9A